VRTVNDRLYRIKALTGYNPTEATHRFAPQAAVLGAKVLTWPETQLPAPA